MLLREIISDGKRTFLSWAMPNKVKKPSIVKVEGLAAGTYQISARTADASKHFKNHTPMLYEDRVVEIRPATVNRFEPNYPEIDTTVEPGDLTVRGVAYDAKGKPLRRKTVCLTPSPEKRLDLKLYYPATRTDREGRFEFTGIRPNMGIVLWCSESPLMLRPEWAGDDATISVDFVVGRQRMNIEVGEPIGQHHHRLAKRSGRSTLRSERKGRNPGLLGELVRSLHPLAARPERARRQVCESTGHRIRCSQRRLPPRGLGEEGRHVRLDRPSSRMAGPAEEPRRIPGRHSLLCRHRSGWSRPRRRPLPRTAIRIGSAPWNRRASIER